ncbi:polyprenyl synthetase family protein [Solidesulfovibrio magneticus]|uniref:Octaprenyl-diphosphate synthase n=1 Tax=Solidesulfovibrio magneticus (strain ATCC 700980 / DSM 13731 / RS-1) TaxID=573370 RepID=C4XLD4_SOLM1|nr:polyprenyl synthetase family protein [Solidesulfovibrio magneticus]BAH77073.1 octaprenyl-diphosphate synthase [Solidesulfovibrio magneticus RS-1]
MSDIADIVSREVPAINRYLESATETLNPMVQPVVRHVLLAGGKRLRPLLTILTARAMGYRADDVYPLACSLEFLHSATLLHDDILDGAKLRRGRESAHVRFGSTHTILAGDVLLALANRLVAEYDNPELTKLLSEALLQTATGEILEIAHLRDVDLPLDTYFSIITGKTAYLIQASCQCGAVLAGASPRLIQAAADLGHHIGVAFQLVDDALDYTSPATVSGKPTGGDLKEGKVTLPLLLYLQGLPFEERRRLAEDFRQDQLSAEDIEYLRGNVVAGGHAEKTREMAGESLAKAQAALAKFPPSPEAELIGDVLAPMLARDK